MNPLVYQQSTGILTFPDGRFAMGYSGHGEDRNVASGQDHKDTGPIPRGKWRLGESFTHPTLGPETIPLIPEPDTETFGRWGFYMHGDSIAHPGEASHGCIALPEAPRRAVIKDRYERLEVVE